MKKKLIYVIFLLCAIFFGSTDFCAEKNIPKLSVIIPIYNVEKYLNECMDSVVGQSYKNIEIICVNDGSADNSEVIIQKYAEKDDRVTVINQKNSGVSVARNSGIERASGEYITFVDPDDTLELDAYEIVMNYLKKENIDILVWGYKTFPFSDTWYEQAGNSSDKLYKSSPIDAYFNEESSTVVWNKIYKSSLIKKEQIKFKEGLKYGEDINFNLLVFPKANNIKFISDKLYNYRIKREGSATTDFERTTKLENQFIMFKGLTDAWNEKGYINNNESKVVVHFTDLAFNEIEGLRGEELQVFSDRFIKIMGKYIKRGYSSKGYPLKTVRKIKNIKKFAKLM